MTGIKAGFICLDCEKNTYRSGEYYMLKNPIWIETHPKKLGMLCLDCVEKRLGRKLTRQDFQSLHMNIEQARKCPELAKRLGQNYELTKITRNYISNNGICKERWSSPSPLQIS